MPNSVEEVRLRIERVLAGGELPASLASRSSGFVFSGLGVDGEESVGVEAGVISNARLGSGRKIGGSDIV